MTDRKGSKKGLVSDYEGSQASESNNKGDAESQLELDSENLKEEEAEANKTDRGSLEYEALQIQND